MTTLQSTVNVAFPRRPIMATITTRLLPPFSLPSVVAQHNENDLPRNNTGKKTRGRQRRKNLTATFDSEPMERLVTGMEGSFMPSLQRPPLDNYIDPQNLPLHTTSVSKNIGQIYNKFSW